MTDIQERQEDIELLWQYLRADTQGSTDCPPLTDAPQWDDDRTIYDRAIAAQNGAKFNDLWEGRWQAHYPSQSEADSGLIDMLMFYSPNHLPNIEQVRRMFLTSALGARAKAERPDYLPRTIKSAWEALQRRLAHQRAAQEAAQRQFDIALPTHPGAASFQQADSAGRFFFDLTDDAEWNAARLAPDCIVENMYYANVGLIAGPGGAAKTTLTLDQCVCITLGLPVYGNRVLRPGPVAILTAEDSREQFIARIREICTARGLTPDQVQHVRRSIRPFYVGGLGVKLTRVVNDGVVPNYPVIDALGPDLASFNPVIVLVDPVVSFGVGESRVNDAEQGLIDAARYIVRNLNCLVLFIHHTGKVNARSKTTDQYSGRGGSAFADGARMVHVLHPLTDKEYKALTKQDLEHGQSALLLSRPKMSYTPPQPDIVLTRTGYRFEHVPTGKQHPSEQLHVNCQAVLQRIKTQVAFGQYPTQRSLQGEREALGMTDKNISDAVAALLSQGRLERAPLEKVGRGGKREYLRPIGDAAESMLPEAPNEGELL